MKTGNKKHRKIQDAINLMRLDSTIYELSYEWNYDSYRWYKSTKKELKAGESWDTIVWLDSDILDDDIDDEAIFMVNNGVLDRSESVPGNIHHIFRKIEWENMMMDGGTQPELQPY